MAGSSSGTSPTGIRSIRIPSATGPIHSVRSPLRKIHSRKIHSQKIPTHLRPPHPDRLDNVDQENSSRDRYRGRLPKSRRCNTQRVKRNRTSPTAVSAILFCVTKIENDTAFFMSPVCDYQYEIATNGELQQAFPGLTRSRRRRQIGVQPISSGVAEHYRITATLGLLQLSNRNSQTVR